MKWSGSIIAFFISALGLVGGVLALTRHALSQPDSLHYSVRGIDVSHHQGAINWPVVARANVRFAYIKATEGQNLTDDRFKANWEGAARAGVARGAYHFFTFCSPGEAQAENFIKLVPVTSSALPPAVDVEFAGNCENPPNRRAIRTQLHALLDSLERRYGRKPLIYTTLSASWLIIDDSFTANPIWIRNLYAPPWLLGALRWTLWQHSDNGAVAGVSTAVDLNVFNGDDAALATCVQRGVCEHLPGSSMASKR